MAIFFRAQEFLDRVKKGKKNRKKLVVAISSD